MGPTLWVNVETVIYDDDDDDDDVITIILIMMRMTMTLIMQDMWEDVKMRVPALAPSNLGGVCNIMKVQVILEMILLWLNF